MLSPFIPFAVAQHSPLASLDDTGVGVYGNGTFAFDSKLDITVGARFDHENRKAELSTPSVSPVPSAAGHGQHREVVLERVAAVRRHVSRAVRRDGLLLGHRGFKAGGFNPAAPAGSEAYGEEHTWNVEGGLKSAWMNRRVTANLSVFSIDWQDLQLNLPNPQVPGQFYISNVGQARSSGAEFELNGRADADVDVFATSASPTRASAPGRRRAASTSCGNTIPNTPDYTASFGTELSHRLTPAVRLYGRAEVVFYGAFKYDEGKPRGRMPTRSPTSASACAARASFVETGCGTPSTQVHPGGVRLRPVAPSGFVGEPGRPRTFGLTAGVTF